MQLAHLLPHLDAEIERLQKARDLLALSSSSTRIVDAFETVRAVRHGSLQARLAPGNAARKSAGRTVAIDAVVSAPPADVPQVSATVSPVRVLTRRAGMPGNESRPVRRKRLTLPDTALRGLVPAGPVVVSAEEARKSQASKTAQATRATEVRQAGAEAMSSFNWRSQTTKAHSFDLLLQKLMSIGESAAPGIDPQLPSLGQK